MFVFSAFLILDQAWDELANRLWNLQLDDEHGSVPGNGWLSVPKNIDDDPDRRTEELLWGHLVDLASLLNYKTLQDDRAYMDNVWACLADVSRDLPLLRVLFGLRRRPLHNEDAQQLGEALDPDCILEAARRLLDPAKINLTPSLRKQALRIVANCCADNDVNRALIIGRDGIEHLKAQADRRHELDVLLPTLYNICVDYDVMAAGSDGAQLSMNDTMDEVGKPQVGMTLTIAEQVLGKFLTKLEKTSIEVFLMLSRDIDSEQHSLLADLIELASRPAIFGIEYVVDTNNPPLVQCRLKNLFDILSLEARSLQEDARESVLQTYFNLLTQQVAQEHMARSSSDLESFVVFLYGDQENFIHNDTFPAAFLKLSYAISSLPAYAEAIGPDFDSDFILFLVHIANVGWAPRAPILVLLTNSLTSIERISRFQECKFDIERTVVSLLGHNRNSDSDTLLPALNFGTRFALTAHGQAELYSKGVFPALVHLLSRDTRSERTLDIHRESFALARLVVKSQRKHAEALLTRDFNLLTSILNLASTTIDASSKLEAGRFMVEVLRTLLASSNIDTAETDPLAASASPSQQASETDPPNSPDLPNLSQSDLFRAETSGSAITAILFLITDAPSSATRAEGLFGLALLSTLPIKDLIHSISDCLSEQREKVLPVLDEIVGAAEQPGRKAEAENLKFLLSHLLKAQPAEQTQLSIEASDEHLDDEIAGQRGFNQELHHLATRLGLNFTA